jgi:L-lactate dehydrogenase complex protein LldF
MELPVTTAQFRQQAFVAIHDVRLQDALEGTTVHLSNARRAALAELPDVEALRDHLKAIRSATLARLAEHLETFETQATAAGAHVHWARNAAEARQIVISIARQHSTSIVTKSKSMTAEEIQLNAALEALGIQVVETDLGEYLIQLAGEMPSHIIAPAIHMTRQRAAELLSRAAGFPLPADDIPRLTAEARRLLREKFLAAGIGISGGNIAVAETGSIVLVTNEGNGRLVTSAPPIHIAIIGIEKIAPTWDDAAVWLALLARSATGQPLSIYTSILSGPARAGDPDGPRELHILLLDNNRSRYMGTEYEEALQCIRCGACLNACPVYREAGGHAYGTPYSGPIGAVVSPLLFGLEQFVGLPQASSLCGACRDVCPARIDIPRMLLALRRDTVEQRLLPWPERLAERFAAAVLAGTRRTRFAAVIGRLLQRPFARHKRLSLPKRFDPLYGRDLPSLSPRSFRRMWEEIKEETGRLEIGE